MLSKPRVLGVDDNPRNLSILRKTLGEEFQLTGVASGEEALEETRRNIPDVILLDVMMPGMDGYETCRRMRARPELSSSKILMVSAKGSAEDRLEGYGAGADDYVVKPFDPDELLAKVRVYVRLRSVEEVNNLKSNLLTLLSHETRTPLTLILGPVSLLIDSGDLTARQRELLGVAEAGARRLGDLVDKVTFLSQLKLRSIPFRKVPADLGAIARDAVARAGDRSGNAGVHLTVEGDGETLIEGDTEHLGWVVGALIDNAIRFSDREGTVRVSTRASDARAALTVSDSGPGIDPEVLQRLFEEFAVPDMNHHQGGHGLSLATARLIVEQHHGTLRLMHSGGPNGTIFEMELPSVPVPAAVRP